MSVPGEDYSSNTVVMVMMMSSRYNKDLWASNLRQGVLLTDVLPFQLYCLAVVCVCVRACLWRQACKHLPSRCVCVLIVFMLIYSDPV